MVATVVGWLLARGGVGDWGLTDIYGVITWGVAAFVAATIAQEYWRAVRARVRKGEENALQAVAALLRKNQQRYGGYVVHLGMVLLFVGVAGSILEEERLENVRPGDELTVSDKRLHYLTAEPVENQHYGRRHRAAGDLPTARHPSAS